jgi:quercetin dioxygenase-like cupin family protein
MFIGHVHQVPEETVQYQGTRGATLRWLLTEKQGAAHFAMRLVTLEPQGVIALHTHPFEHEIFVIRGHGAIIREDGRVPVGPGSFLFVPGDEPHGFETTGEEPLELVCCINTDRSLP